TNPLVGYLAIHSNRWYTRLQQKWGLYLGEDVGPKGSFLQKLAAFRDLHLRWYHSDVYRPWQVWARAEEEKRALGFVKQNKSALGWAMLTLLQDRAQSNEFHQAVADACKHFDDTPELRYVARYERARHLYRGDKEAEAAVLFRDLYQAMLKEGILPPI